MGGEGQGGLWVAHIHCLANGKRVIASQQQVLLCPSCSPAAIKAQSLTFDISGEGNLPRVTVLRPVLHSKGGSPLLLFKKLLLGDSEKLPLVLHNAGGVPVQVRTCLGNAPSALGTSPPPVEERPQKTQLGCAATLRDPFPSLPAHVLVLSGNVWCPSYVIFYLTMFYYIFIKLSCRLIPFCSLLFNTLSCLLIF